MPPDFWNDLTLALIRYELILGLKSSNFRHPARLNLSQRVPSEANSIYRSAGAKDKEQLRVYIRLNMHMVLYGSPGTVYR